MIYKDEIINSYKPIGLRNNKIKTAIIISGIPGAGKTYLRNDLIKKYKLNNPFIIDPDEYLKQYNITYEEMSEITKDIEKIAINKGFDIIFDKVYSYIKDLEKLILLLVKNNYYIIFNLIYVDLNIALERNLNRSRNIDKNIIIKKYNEFKKNGFNGYKNIINKANICAFYSNNELIFYKYIKQKFYFNLNIK